MNVYAVKFSDGEKWYTAENFECVQGCFRANYIRYVGKAVNFKTEDIDGHCEGVDQFVCTERN